MTVTMKCSCPTSLGYRFHRYPCSRAGEIENLVHSSDRVGPRPAWDEYFLGIAGAVAQRADCTRSKVGAVLVGPDHRVHGTGYNGARPGGPSCLAGECPRGRMNLEEVPPGSSYDTGAGSCVAIHAELNVILYTSPDERLDGTVYVTREPCDGCLRVLQGSGVRQIVWPEGRWELVEDPVANQLTWVRR